MASSVLSMSAASLASKSKVVSSKVFSAKKSASRKVSITTRATGTMVDDKTGIKKMRDGIKEAADENLLTPRFYTTGTFHLLSFSSSGMVSDLYPSSSLFFISSLFPVVSPGRFLLLLWERKDIFSRYREENSWIELCFFFLYVDRSVHHRSTRDDEVEEDVIHGARAWRGQCRENARTTDQTNIVCIIFLSLKKNRFRRNGTALFYGNQPESRRV